MKKIIYIILPLVLFSCKSEENKQTETTKIESEEQLRSYIQLNIDNFWVYETYSIDTAGNETFVRKDSVYIPSDTLLNEIKYYKYVEAPAFGTTDTVIRFFRDSSGYLIDSKGTILFSDNNFSDTLRQIIDTGLYTINYIMKESGKINVPAGEFKNTLCYKGNIYIQPLFDNWNHPDSHDNYYAPGVGKIKSTAFYISKPIILERRLIRYGVSD